VNARLIPWCLAVTGFLASLTVFTWQGRRDAPGQPVPPQAAVGHRLMPPATEPRYLRSSQAATLPQTPPDAASTLILPLPPATRPEPDPNLQPLPDDQPTVDDLPARRSPPESPAMPHG
jgi:hypothetical protein